MTWYSGFVCLYFSLSERTGGLGSGLCICMLIMRYLRWHQTLALALRELFPDGNLACASAALPGSLTNSVMHCITSTKGLSPTAGVMGILFISMSWCNISWGWGFAEQLVVVRVALASGQRGGTPTFLPS